MMPTTMIPMPMRASSTVTASDAILFNGTIFPDACVDMDPSGTDVSGIEVVIESHMETPAKWSSNARIVMEKPVYKKMMEIRDMVTNDELGDNNPTSLSTSLDILGTYIKGQRILYTESKVYCEQQLNMLMLPAIFISALCTLLSIALQTTDAGPYVVSALTAINSFLLALISYLKLDAKAEAHKTSAYQYDKLRTICEFNSGKIMFFIQKEDWQKVKQDIMKLVEEIQKKLEEVKDTNKFILPQYIRHNFPELYSQNLFSNVKRLQIDELLLLTDLRSTENNLLDVEARIKLIETGKVKYDVKQLQDEIEYRWKERDIRNGIRKKIIEHRKLYMQLEEEYKTEIKTFVDIVNKKRYRCCSWLKT
jgi:hypothetical protein